jgi:hypothetical protein
LSAYIGHLGNQPGEKERDGGWSVVEREKKKILMNQFPSIETSGEEVGGELAKRFLKRPFYTFR